MNIKLPTPGEMPTRLYDLMVQRFQLELVQGFTATDTALNSWFTEKLEGRNILRASFTFDYDIAVEGEHLPKVMELMLQTVRSAGWFAEVHSATLDVCEIAFSELGEDEDDSEDEDLDPEDLDPELDAGVILSLDNNGNVEDDKELSDTDDEDDDSEVGIRDGSEIELEFEDEEESEDDDEDASDDSEEDDSESEPAPTGTRVLVDAITAFGDAVNENVIDWTDIVELDATTVVLELSRNGEELEIEVAAKFDEASGSQDVVYHVTPLNKTTLHFASLSALMAYLKEVYGDANKS